MERTAASGGRVGGTRARRDRGWRGSRGERRGRLAHEPVSSGAGREVGRGRRSVEGSQGAVAPGAWRRTGLRAVALSKWRDNDERRRGTVQLSRTA